MGAAFHVGGKKCAKALAARSAGAFAVGGVIEEEVYDEAVELLFRSEEGDEEPLFVSG